MGKTGRRARTRGSIIVISAPSGAGKSTLVRHLMASLPTLTFSISHTTRLPRPGERNGRDYFFVSPGRFERMAAAGDFIEWAEVFGNLYGTSWKQLRAAQERGADVLLDIDVQGHRQVRRCLPEALSVFVLPPSFQVLERRLRNRRSEAPEAIEKRLTTARKEIASWPEYDYLVVNNRLSRATQDLRAVVSTARLRRQNQEEHAQEISKTFGG